MIDFPIGDLLDEQACLAWIEAHLHPDGLVCPQCGAAERRLFRTHGLWPAFRCRACHRYFTLLSGTALAKTHQPPSTIVLLLRGVARGEPTARLARELPMSRAQVHILRHRLQRNLYDTLPRAVLEDEVLFEADEVYINAGEKRGTPPRPRRPAAP